MLRINPDEMKRRIESANDKISVIGTYSLWNDKIEVQCKKCGAKFYAQASALLKGHGCASCAGNRKIDTAEFKKRISEISPQIEVLGEYVNAKTPIKCRCTVCKREFFGSPYQMLHKKTGCLICSIKKSWRTNRKDDLVTYDKFMQKLEEYPYRINVIGKYSGYHEKLDVECCECGHRWSVIPATMISQNNRCPMCVKNSSQPSGELSVAVALDAYGEPYEREKTFDGCRNERLLRFDFYLPQRNVCIEFDGRQHSSVESSFGSTVEEKKKNFKATQTRDNIKSLFCKSHNIKLIRIPDTKKGKIYQIISRTLDENPVVNTSAEVESC